ncbi:DUF456 domain-containing protein [Aquibacillus sp. 3ASR75-11]|uniref:DUF456 domain-containing protein n=1 Tax=Terrihalobacillus insolitus TaxID=2950438 RepID=A0A9X4APM9_9BACI|nr:DUF456 domain-containing protein [Terrihalobacillus insolitus]MDC3425723.1 DUF456 domain-containing protein [Terrihalobacillus insolitus]
MDILIWILIAVFFVLSFVSIVFPIIPGPLVLWIGFLLYFFFLDGSNLSAIFWVAMVLLTGLLIVADIIANSYFVKRFGGSKWGERAAAIGVIVGSFILPPFGIIIVPFAAVFIVELLQRKTSKDAWMASLGSLMGFLGGSIAKIVIQVIMIVWFLIEI